MFTLYLKKSNQSFSRSPSERFKSNSYLKFHEERVKSIQKDENKKNHFHNPTTVVQVNEKYKKLSKNESNVKQNTNSSTSNSERQLNSFLINNDDESNEQNPEKLNCRKIIKYPDRPVIQVDIIPTRKMSNIPKSKMKLSQFILNRKLNQKQLSDIVTNKININEDDDTISKINKKNSQDSIIDVKKILELKNNNFKKDSNSKCSIKMTKIKGNDEKEEITIGEEQLFITEIERDQKEIEENVEKHLAKGDFTKNISSHLPEVEGLYQHLDSPGDSLKSKFSPNDNESLNRGNEEEMISKNYFLDEKKLLSQVEEENEESIDFNYSSEENSNDEWSNPCLDSKRKSSEKIKSPQRKKSVQKRKSLQKLKLLQEKKSSSKEFLERKKSLPENIRRKQKKKTCQEKILTQEKISSQGQIFSVEKKNSQQIKIWQSTGIQTSLIDIPREKIQTPFNEEENDKNFNTSASVNKLKIFNSKHSGNELNFEKISSETNNEMSETLKISSLYKKILNGEEGMDWETFQQLVETLHPPQRELWKDVCNVVKNEAKRVSGTQVCIEVKSISSKKSKIRKKDDTGNKNNANEISIEMDMKLKDVEDFFEKKLRTCLINNRKIRTGKIHEKKIT